MTTISITEDDLIASLGGFLQDVLGTDFQVLKSQTNRVAMPTGDFVMMTPLVSLGLSTNISTYTDGNPGTQNNSRSTQWNAQLDFYGRHAANNCAMVATLIRTEYACTWMAEHGDVLTPLYAGDPRQTSLINGEQQYENRWTLDFVGEYRPIVQSPMQFATQLQPNVVDVDVRFPP